CPYSARCCRLQRAAPSVTPVFSFTPPASTPSSALPLHDALPICWCGSSSCTMKIPASFSSSSSSTAWRTSGRRSSRALRVGEGRSEEHTSELQSRFDLVCRLLLAKKDNVCSLRLDADAHSDTAHC